MPLRIIEPSSCQGHDALTDNTKLILSTVCSFLNEQDIRRRYSENVRLNFLALFPQSLGQYAAVVTGHVGYSDVTLFQQVKYIKETQNEASKHELIKLLVLFYRYLVIRNQDVEYFDSFSIMNWRLLCCASLPKHLLDGYSIIRYSHDMEYNGQDHVIFSLFGFDRHSTRKAKEDYVIVDFGKFNEPFFKQLYFDYIKSSIKHFQESCMINSLNLSDALNYICAVKQSEFSINKSITHWTIAEAQLLKRFIDNMTRKQKGPSLGRPITLATKNNRIGFFRRWFSWAEARGYMTFENTFFGELVQYEEPVKREGHPIPEKDLKLLFELAYRKSSEGLMNRQYYLAMKFLHQADFRPSDMFSLQRNLLGYAVSANAYTIRHKTKTSGQNKQLDVLTKADFDILKEVIELTEPLRQQTPDSTLKEYIFLHTSPNITDVRKLGCPQLYDYMKSLCVELGFTETYGPYDLRHTYKTKVFEDVVVNNYTECEAKCLSRHTKMSTTMGYVKKKRADYFKALYGVMLEDVQMDISSKVVDVMPDNAQELGVREGGCGRCRAANCLYQTILPCITCNNFVTTPEYEPFFKRMVQDIDEQLDSAVYQHDREDLVTMKEIYVSFLIEFDAHRSSK